MALETFDLARAAVEETWRYPVLVSEFEDQSEQRRLRTQKKIVGFKITSPRLTRRSYEDYRDFFQERQGAYAAFEFESPFDGITYEVRFTRELKTIYKNAHYICTFELTVINVLED